MIEILYGAIATCSFVLSMYALGSLENHDFFKNKFWTNVNTGMCSFSYPFLVVLAIAFLYSVGKVILIFLTT